MNWRGGLRRLLDDRLARCGRSDGLPGINGSRVELCRFVFAFDVAMTRDHSPETPEFVESTHGSTVVITNRAINNLLLPNIRHSSPLP